MERRLMIRANLLIGLALIACGSAAAQSTSIRIGTNFISPTGDYPLFVVDGTQYLTPQNFVWPIGSKHTVQFLLSTNSDGQSLGYQSSINDTIRFSFGSWQANGGVSLAPA